MTEHHIMEATDRINIRPYARTGYQAVNVHCHDAADGDVRAQLWHNDPAIAGLDMRVGDFADSVGRAIIHNTCLQKLVYRIDPEDSAEELSSFCSQLARNRSIEHLTVCGFYHSHLDLFSILSPFFEHNRNLRCIEITQRDMSLRVPSLVSTLMQSRSNRFERIDLFASHLGDVNAIVLINTLIATPGLCYLLELGLAANAIGRLGCTSVCNLLKNSESNLHRLDLSSNDLDDECIINLSDALRKRSNLNVLDLRYQRLTTPGGWIVFSTLLSNPECSLEAICLSENKIGDLCSKSLGNSLAINHTLKRIDIGECTDVTSTGWRGFLKCLSSPVSALEVLEIYKCGINDDGARLIFAALRKNTSLRKLNMSNNKLITYVGWLKSFRLCLGSGLVLEDIDLSENNINDRGAAMLVNLLLRSRSVSSLSIHDNYHITDRGWSTLADVLLPTSSSRLEMLSLGLYGCEYTADSRINDGVLISFANRLQINTTLKVLKFGGFAKFTKTGWESLKSTLCNESNVNSTYNSNHTLIDFQCGHRLINVPYDVRKLLLANRDEGKHAVSRRKILDCHFPVAESSIQIFSSVPATVLPNVFSWIGYKRSYRDELSLMYSLVRHMSWMSW
jgi:Ran GTPase-activating protein (RanGAP) involved in mRNA processing and transport